MRYFSAASFSSVVPPLAVTTFELTTDSAGLGRMNGRAALGVALVSTTVVSSFLATVTPSSRKDGLPFIPMRRCREKTTSSALIGVPSENTRPWASVKVSVFASGESVYDDARSPTGFVRSLFANVSSVSYMPFVSICPVSSYSRPGSTVLRSKLESMTSVPPPEPAPPDEPPLDEPLPQATKPEAVRTAAATSTSERPRPRVDVDPIMCTSVLTARQTDCCRS